MNSIRTPISFPEKHPGLSALSSPSRIPPVASAATRKQIRYKHALGRIFSRKFLLVHNDGVILAQFPQIRFVRRYMTVEKKHVAA